MDILATQVYEDNDFIPARKVSRSTQQDALQEEIGVLNIGSNTYPIKKGINKIGRHPDCNIILNNQTVSKKHAEIEANSHEASAWICDLNSSNKTKLNNSILRPGRYYELKDGNVIEFGMVQAVYKVCHPINEIPPLNRQKKQLIIPGTPDSSLENISTIPATQADDEESVFRCPTLPLRTSTSSISKNGVPDSSIDDSLDNSRSFGAARKESVGEQRISIHDMETQSSFESHDEISVDIHDVETQKISLSNIKDFRKSLRKQEGNISEMETQRKADTPMRVINIHDVETQHDEDTPTRVTDIHDVETQHDVDTPMRVTDIHDVETQHGVDIHDMKTPRKMNAQNVTARDDSARSIEKLETSGINEKQLTNREKNDINNTVAQNVGANKSTFCSNSVDTDADEVKHTKNVKKAMRKGSQEYLELSIATNFEDEPSELNQSQNLLDSRYLLEDLAEDEKPLDETKLKSSPVKDSRISNDNDANEKSTDDENIFDAATQVNNIDRSAFKRVTQRVNFSFGTSLMNSDSDETEEEGMLQTYSYNRNKDNEKSSKSQASDSEDSSTDEEGRFTEIAIKQKQAASNSFEVRPNESKEVKSDTSSSKDSEDLFDTLTQPIKLKIKDSPDMQSKEDKVEVDFDVPTQVIYKKETKNNVEVNEDTETKEIDDMAPTQIVPITIIPPATLARNKGDSDNEDITELEDNTPTQIISITEKVSELASDEPASPLNLLKKSAIEEYSVENIDYEMAPTQRISDIDQQISVSTTPSRSKSLNKTNADDSLERNLNAMFEEVNEERIEERSEISTQILENVLRSSQSVDELPAESRTRIADSGSLTESRAKKSTKGKKSKASVVDSTSNSVSNKKSRKSNIKNMNTDNDSQSAENYFSALTSRRKRNVLEDSQDFTEPDEHRANEKMEEEETTSKTVNAVNDKNGSISVATPKSVGQSASRSLPNDSSTPKSTPKSSKKKKHETLDIFKNDNDKSDECSKTVDSQTPSTSVVGEQLQQTLEVLENDDEDILAGLPEVRISGTLSNPPSPTSSTSSKYRININHYRSKRVSRIAQKKKGPSRKSSRRTLSCKNTENAEPYHTISKPNSSTILGNMSNAFSSNFDVDKVSVRENDDEKIKKFKASMRKETSGSSRRSKESDAFLQSKSVASIDFQEKTNQSPSVQGNRRTRNSRKENVDYSSVFQVGKEALIEKTAAEPAKKNVLNVSRIGKRSLSMVDTIESSDSKKRKEDVNEDVPIATRGRKRNAIASRRQSENILDFVGRTNSPRSLNDSSNSRLTPSESSLDKQAIIKIVRVSSPLYTPTGSISPSTPTELDTENVNNNKTRQTRRTNVVNSQVLSSTSTKGNKKTVRNVETRRTTNQRAISKIEPVADDMSSQIGEESQEIEMIMNGSLGEQSSTVNAETKKDASKNTRVTRTRNTRKRKNVNVHSDTESMESSSVSSTLCESDDAHFETPILKAKRAKISKNNSNVIGTAISESIKETVKSSKPSTRSVRGRQKISTDSSVEEGADTTANQTTLDNTTSKTNNSRAKRQRQKAGKIEADNKEKKDLIKETASSETDTSILSTPSITRRSMSSSFSVSSPLSVKHKILFTGISNNNSYNRLLTKLGALQVEDIAKCTVLVTDRVRRTLKFLCALAQAVPIVSIDWLVDSEKAGHFVDLESYILKDRTAENKFGFKLEKSLEKAKEHKLLEGYTLVLSRGVAPPPIPELKSIILSCGGKPLVRPPPSWPQKAMVISREEDLANAKKFLVKAPKTVTIQSTEFLLTGILRQELNFTEFKLT